jgi:hypothetical protein
MIRISREPDKLTVASPLLFTLVMNLWQKVYNV